LQLLLLFKEPASHLIRFLKYLLPPLAFLTASNKLLAEHLVGGTMTYRCIGDGSIPNTKNYRVRLTLTRDCSQFSNFSSTIEIGLYRFNGSQYVFSRKLSGAIQPERMIPQDQKSCSFLQYTVCVKEAYYEIDFQDVPVIDQTYLFAFQECCRNMTISNITEPGRTGYTIMVQVTAEAQRICNQSPSSDLIPPLVLCANQEMNLDLASTDAEGDQLTYELCAPLAGGGPAGLNSVGDPVSCNGIRPNPALCPPPLTAVNYSSAGTTAQNPFPSAIPITLINGILRALPNMVGQYVFGICIKEYRNGILLSVQQREMQINIDVCSSPTASIQADRTSNDTAYIRICDPDEEFRIINTTADTQLVKSISWEFTPPSGANWSDSTFDFTRTLADTGLYTGLMILNKGNQCSDSIHIRLKVNPKLEVRPDAVYDSCRFDPIQFGVQVISGQPVSFEWEFGDSTRSDLRDPVHAYASPGEYMARLTTQDAQGCSDVQFIHLVLFPAPPDFDLSIPDSIICYPDSILLGIAGISDPSYQYRWEVSNGIILTGPSPKLGLNVGGRFSIKATLISKTGCRSEKTFSILSLESPVAEFDLVSDQLNLRQPDLMVINRSRNASSYRWDFGDGQFSTQVNPSYAYQGAGSYTVQLVAYHVNGCSDTVQRPLSVSAASDFYLPNIFTPNGDGQNDIFKPEGIEGFFSGYDLSIFDRWGSLLFFSEDQSQGWDGTRGATNKMALDGVYIYVVRFATEDGEKKIVKGSVTLIR